MRTFAELRNFDVVLGDNNLGKNSCGLCMLLDELQYVPHPISVMAIVLPPPTLYEPLPSHYHGFEREKDYDFFKQHTTSKAASYYKPSPRFAHICESVRSNVVVQGGRTKNFSKVYQQHLASVVEIFNPYHKLWVQTQVTGDSPSPGTYHAASASLHDYLFSFGGKDGCGNFFNTLHRLDTKTWHWCQLSAQNAKGAPMPKYGCRMISFRESLAVFGGYGLPQGPPHPQSFIKNTSFTDGRGWTNEFHIYNLMEGFNTVAYMHYIVKHLRFPSLSCMWCCDS